MNAARKLKRNQHRVIAAYLVLYAWKTSTDALIIPRQFFEKTLEISKFTNTRLDEIGEDFAGYFEFRKTLVYSGSSKFATLLVARSKLEDIGPKMSDRERAKYLIERGIPTAVVSEKQGDKRLNFENIISSLISIGCGVIEPSDLPNTTVKPT